MPFIVMRREHQYNDEYYYVDDESVGVPVKIYETREEAAKYCKHECLRWLVGMSPRDVINFLPEGEPEDEDWSEFEKRVNNRFKEVFKGKLKKLNGWSDPGIPEKATDVQLEKIYELIKPYFSEPFFVMELKDE